MEHGILKTYDMWHTACCIKFPVIADSLICDNNIRQTLIQPDEVGLEIVPQIDKTYPSHRSSSLQSFPFSYFPFQNSALSLPFS